MAQLKAIEEVSPLDLVVELNVRLAVVFSDVYTAVTAYLPRE